MINKFKIPNKVNEYFLPLKSKLILILESGKYKKNAKMAAYLLGPSFTLLVIYFFFLSAPHNFPAGTIFKIEKGTNLRKVSEELKEEHIIKSRLAFEAMVIISKSEFKIKHTDYFFEAKLPAYEVVRRITRGEHHLAPIVATIPEGFNSVEISEVLVSRLPNFNKEEFLTSAADKEGFLFPDTYFFLMTATAEDVLESLSSNYNKKIKPLRAEFAASGKSEQQIITMASIIEREAKGDADRGVISGILWKRIRIGMPLQVDAAPITYKNKGLPEAPIANPGLEAIGAAIYPKSTPYLYYLHDKEGNIHYASTYSEHNKNINLYLR